MQRLCGKSPSSIPQRKTNLNSRPFAMCSVIICTLSCPASDSRSPDSSTACARKAWSGGRSTSVLSAALGARRALIRLLPAVMLDEPALLQHEIDLLVQGEPFGLPRQPVDEIMEAAYGARRPAALLRLAASDGRFPQRGTGAPRLLAQGLHGSLADTARRQVHDPLIGGIVVPIRHQPQIRERVFYLRALEEPQAAIDLVWNAAGDERFLERTRL